MIASTFGTHAISDAHTHFFDKSFLAGLGKQLGLGPQAAGEVARRLGWNEPADDPAELGRAWVAEMDRHGVDRMVSIHTLPGDLDSAAKGIAAAGGRLIGYAMVNPLDPNAPAVAERAATELGFRGIALFPAMFGFSVASDAASAVLDVANRHGLNVFIHCGVLKVGFRTKLGLPCAFDMTLSNPLALAKPAAQFPRAKFIVPHLGSGYFRELLMLADMAPNVYADTSGVAGWAKYLDGNPSPVTVLRQAVDVMGSRRLLFGSDSTFFPRGWRHDIFERQLQLFEEAKLSAEDVGRILGGNMEEIVGSN
ncbi:MAG: amidohydrolase 2 [Phycisphaerales bacterium]|nr:amidohydrolase 2 [Phycisphaerales bacterium]